MVSVSSCRSTCVNTQHRFTDDASPPEKFFLSQRPSPMQPAPSPKSRPPQPSNVLSPPRPAFGLPANETVHYVRYSFTELKLCEGDGGVPASRKLSGTRTASSLTSSSTWSSSVGRDGAGSSGTSSQIKDIRQSGKKKDGKKVGTRTTMNNIRGSGLRE